MKLSQQQINIDWAFTALLSFIKDLHDHEHNYAPLTYRRQVRSDLPRNRPSHIVPTIPARYDPSTHFCSTDNKHKLLLLLAYEATYHESITPLRPDMVPLVIDTGASVTVTPYHMDFIGPITPVQAAEIKGIAERLQV
jgi:hypothetical protein